MTSVGSTPALRALTPAALAAVVWDSRQFTVPTNGSNLICVELAPDRVGENVLTAQARYEDGSLSPVRVWMFLVAG